MMTPPQVAKNFLELVAAGKIAEAYDRFVAPDFRHHNPYFEGNASALRQGMEESVKQFPGKIMEIKHIVTEGDLVVVHSRVQLSPDKALAVVHLFRCVGDRIVELWDVGQAIPETSINKNGMF